MADTPTTAAQGRPRVFQHPGRVAVVVVVVLLVLNVGYLLIRESDTSTGSSNPLPATVASVLPEPGTIAGPIDTIVVDLDDTYTGVLLVSQNNGAFVEIPEDQLDRVVELGQVAYRPGPDKEITRFTPGTVRVSVLYWPKNRLGGRPQHPASYTWSFEVKA
jgi:hypothetical protein